MSLQSNLARAKLIIAKAEDALGKLSSGQRRDLLMDNTGLESDYIGHLVFLINEEEANGPKQV